MKASKYIYIKEMKARKKILSRTRQYTIYFQHKFYVLKKKIGNENLKSLTKAFKKKKNH